MNPVNEQETVAKATPGVADQLRQRIADRTATIGVIGLGYVGLPLILTFSEAGFPTVGFDVDAKKVESLRRGQMYIQHLDGARLTRALSGKRFQASEDFARLAEADVVIICVPTPLTPQREPDMSYVDEHRAPGRGAPSRGAARRAGVHDVSRNDRRARPRPSRADRARVRRAILPGVLARARGPGQPVLLDRHHPEGRRRSRPARRRPRPGRLRHGRDANRARPQRPDRRGDEAGRKHLPGREHRARRTSSRWSSTAWESTCGRSSTPPRRSPSASCASTRARAGAATASRSTPSTCRGRRASSASRRASSSSPARSTSRCRTTSSRNCSSR